MSGDRVERRLAAILAADVVSYSRLIEQDETGTLRRLRNHRHELIDPTIGEHRGRIVKTTGDALLVEFPSVVDAVRCALEVQRGMAERNVEVPADNRIEFRVGIHQGDIVFEDSDIFGDGVNIAARLEGLAEAGGICVSARVQEDATGKLDLAFRDLGEQQLKNISRPVRVYAVVDAERRPLLVGVRIKPVPRISLIVLPFISLSPDLEQQYFADAITEDLTTDLTRIPDSFVIARTTAFTYKGKAVDVRQVARELGVRYVLEGSVRRLGERLQVNVQLLDGETGSHVWADRFDTDRHDLAEAQREIVGRLAGQLTFELIRDVGRRIEQENAADPDASAVALRARAVRLQTLATNVQALRAMVALLERALILDPDTVDARNELAVILVNGVAEAVSTSIEQDIARAEQLITEAVERDPNRSEVHKTMGFLRRVQGRWSESQVELERAIELDPNNYVAIRQLGITVLAQGEPDAAMQLFERAMPAEARQQHQFNGYCQLGRCHLFSGRNAEAVGLFRRARTLAPGIFYVHLDLAGALGLVGNLDEAKSEIAEALKLKPEINSIARWRASAVTQGLGHPQFQALREKTTYAGLRAAGFPEE